MYYPSNFDVIRAVELARLVVQAYDQLDSFQAGAPWTPKGGYTLVKELVQESTGGFPGKVHTQFDTELKLLRKARTSRENIFPIGFVAKRGASVYVIFRGTVTVVEWVRNLNVRLSDYPKTGYGKVHEGFLETYGIIHKKLLEVLAEQDPKSQLFIAGHSLGAALATLALPDIATSNRFRVATIYTFGSPRVGDDQFCHAFDRMFGSRSFRVANTSDMVVSLPLPVPIFGIIGGYFSHVETPVDFTAQNGALEKNHIMGTYLSALLMAQGEKKVFKKMFGWRLSSR